MGVKHPSNSLSTVLFLKVIKKLEANVFKFFDYPKMSFVSQPGLERQVSRACQGSFLYKCRSNTSVVLCGSCAAQALSPQAPQPLARYESLHRALAYGLYM